MSNTPANPNNDGERIRLFNYRKPTDGKNNLLEPIKFEGFNSVALRAHVAWMTNQAKPVLNKDICYELNRCVKLYADKRSIGIISGELKRESVYISLNFSPRTSIEKEVLNLKQCTSDALMEAFPSLLREYPNGQLWSLNYFCSTNQDVLEDLNDFFQKQTQLTMAQCAKRAKASAAI
jgi:REP element-mobilizing transposase RayT